MVSLGRNVNRATEAIILEKTCMYLKFPPGKDIDLYEICNVLLKCLEMCPLSVTDTNSH